jgi:adenylylsulfate kinase
MEKCDTHQRSIVKTVTWRIIATMTTVTLVYIFFRKLEIAAAIGGIEVVLKLIFYFIHERAWDRVRWGKITLESEANGS